MHYNPWHEPYNEILYEASAKLSETTSSSSSGLHTNAFNTTIQSHTFENSQGKIIFNGDVTSIGYTAFYNCSGLTSITIPNRVTSIGASAFEGCSGLTSITIPNSVTSIGASAFYGCSNVTELIYAEGCTTALRTYLTNITSITIPNSVTSIDNRAFYDCSGLTSVTIPNSVTSIGNSAFKNCSGLTSVTIPNSVTNIERSAFYDCANLTTMTIEATTPPTLGNTDAISTAITAIYAPSESVNAYKRATNWSSFADKIQAMP